VKLSLWLLFCLSSSLFSLAFQKDPTLIKESDSRYFVEFTLSEATDVTVSLINAKDSSCIRHLAAGVLGPTAPPPLLQGTLTQKIEWDGTDDRGIPIPATVTVVPRVRAKMSVRLKNLVGDDPYLFSRTIEGLTTDHDGNLIISGGLNNMTRLSGIGTFTIRQFTADGIYIKTLFPFASNKPIDSVKGYDLIEWGDGSYSPKLPMTQIPIFGTALPARQNTAILKGLVPGTLQLFCWFSNMGPTMYNKMGLQTMSTTGSIPTLAPIIPLDSQFAEGVEGPQQRGAAFYCPSANPRYLYFSGRYTAIKSDNRIPEKSCYYRDGRVFRMDLESGATSLWLNMDTLPDNPAAMDTTVGVANVFAIYQGIAVDDSGHVFVCDRWKSRIGVYDTMANLIDSIPLKDPENVFFSKTEGALYAVSKSYDPKIKPARTGILNLYKFSSWRHPATPICSTQLFKGMIDLQNARTHLATTTVSGQQVLWVGYSSFGVKGLLTNNNRFTEYKKFKYDPFLMGNDGTDYGFGHMDLDRRNESVYFTNNKAKLYKITDWNHPVVVACSTSSKSALEAADLTIGTDNLLYVKVFGQSEYKGPVLRKTLNHYHTPAPYANTGNDTCIKFLESRFDARNGDHGLAVSPKGQISTISWRGVGRSKYYAMQFENIGGQDTGKAIDIAGILTSQNGGIRYDGMGNVYLGVKASAPDRLLELPYISDEAYQGAVGGVVKLPQDLTQAKVNYTAMSGSLGDIAKISGSLKEYPADLSPFPAYKGGCACPSPRFDVDPYGRLFIPSAVTQKVTVIDNNGNLILKFGQYGNIDSRGGLAGPGQTIPTPAIPLAWPYSACASEEHIFVSDMMNNRIVRLAMDYELDNMPGLSVEDEPQLAQGQGDTLSMTASPNPFNPQCEISVRLPISGRVQIAILEVSGRRVRMLTATRIQKASVIKTAWDGKNEAGLAVASGMYLVRVTTETKSLSQKIILAR